MSETFTTPEGFELPKRLLLPDVRDFADLFEYVREWDHATMTAKDGVIPKPDLVPTPVLVDNMRIGPFLSFRRTGRCLAIRPTPATVAAVATPSEKFATIRNEGTVGFELIEHTHTGRVLVTAKENQALSSHYLAYIDPATIPAVPEKPAGNYAIKVDGEEIDHADTPAEAGRARNTIIYGEIGTEGNTTIEPRNR
jgi:hypothetical protein